MADTLDSGTSAQQPTSASRPSGWFRVGVIAVASAMAGGMAAAWFYRKTLIRLRQAEANPAGTPPKSEGTDPDDE